MHTLETVRALLVSHYESNEPDEVLAVLKAHDGKQLTKRLLAKLPGGEERWLIRQVASMTSLEDRDYLQSQGNRGIHLLIAYQTKNIMIDAEWIEKYNPAYFEGRRERNQKREAVVGDPVLLQSMADALNGYSTAKAKLEESAKRLDALTGYGGSFSPDSFDWERLCGAREEKS
jgi:hypothetical protein